MSKWKCEICGSGFDNFRAQGFDNKIYCPLCYFKKLSADLQVENFKLKDKLEKQRKEYQETYKDVREEIKGYKEQLQQRDEVIEEILNTSYFDGDCPYSIIGDGWIEKLCDCNNCKDNYKECWLKYFKYKGE